MENVAAEVVNLFVAFISEFSNEMDELPPSSAFGEASASKDYLEQIDSMKENERTTLYVDWSHLQQHDIDLADAIKEHFHFLEPHLRQAVIRVMADRHEGYAQDRDFHVSFFNLPHLCAIRELRTDKIATLIRFPRHTRCDPAPVAPPLSDARFGRKRTASVCFLTTYTLVCSIWRPFVGVRAASPGP